MDSLDRFEDIMRTYRAPAMALALNVLGNREDAEDACQEAFAAAYRVLKPESPPPALKAWLFTVLYRKCLDVVRRRRRSERLFRKVRQEAPDPETPGRREPRSLSDKLVLSERVLGVLGEKERLILSLWAQEEYTLNEIAKVLACAPSTVRVHLFQVRRKIKALMEKSHVPLPTR
jgi:RNA polymerase sigma-70 factor (ECF subfamily)